MPTVRVHVATIGMCDKLSYAIKVGFHLYR